MRRTFPHLAAIGTFVGVLAPTAAFAHGDLSGLAIVIPSVLALHTASIAIALLLQRKHRSWLFIAVAVLAAAVASIMWFLGFLQFANYLPTATQEVWLWVWLLVPFVLAVLSAASALYQRYSDRAA